MNFVITFKMCSVCLCAYRYHEALVSLVSQILQKVQFRYNQSQLDELDDETLDDDVSSKLKSRKSFR